MSYNEAYRTNDIKKVGGYFKEKLKISFSHITGDEVERSIMKVTSHAMKAPSKKHIFRLIQATHGFYSRETVEAHGGTQNVNLDIVIQLEKRTHVHNWVVVMKALIMFHYFLQEGSLEINRVIQNRRSLFTFSSFKQLADSFQGAVQQSFIHDYIRYLEERNINQIRIDVSVKIEKSEYLTVLKTLPNSLLAQVMMHLLHQMRCLGDIGFIHTACNNTVTMEAYRLLVSDGKHLYRLTFNRMMHVLSAFDKLTLPEKQEWFTVYEMYCESVEKVARMFDDMTAAKVGVYLNVPEIKVFPKSLRTTLKQEIEISSIPVEEVDSVLVSANLYLEKPNEETEKQKEPTDFLENTPVEVVSAPPLIPDLDDIFGAPSLVMGQRGGPTRHLESFEALLGGDLSPAPSPSSESVSTNAVKANNSRVLSSAIALNSTAVLQASSMDSSDQSNSIQQHRHHRNTDLFADDWGGSQDDMSKNAHNENRKGEELGASYAGAFSNITRQQQSLSAREINAVEKGKEFTSSKLYNEQAIYSNNRNDNLGAKLLNEHFSPLVLSSSSSIDEEAYSVSALASSIPDRASAQATSNFSTSIKNGKEASVNSDKGPPSAGLGFVIDTNNSHNSSNKIEGSEKWNISNPFTRIVEENGDEKDNEGKEMHHKNPIMGQLHKMEEQKNHFFKSLKEGAQEADSPTKGFDFFGEGAVPTDLAGWKREW